MIFTAEQYKSLGGFYLDDFPLDIDDELGLKILNSLSTHIQGDIISWGFSDSVIRESIFNQLCKRLWISIDKYYESEIYRNFRNSKTLLNEDQIKIILGDK